MHDKLKKTVLLTLMLTAFIPAWADSGRDKLVEQHLSWEAVEGAWGYEVIIRSGSEEMIRQETEESELTFSLNPGEYEFSLNVLNKFKKIEATTPWKALIIREAFQPVVRLFTPEEVFRKDRGTLTIEAEIYQVRPDTAFFLSDTEGRKVEGKQIELKEESVRLEFPREQLSPGTYSLTAVDPSGLTDTSEITVLTVLEVFEPEIRSVSERKLVQKQVYPEIIVKGKGFKEGLSARVFQGDQSIVPYEIEWLSTEEVRIALITGEVTPGRYNLEISNPSGFQVEKKLAFVIDKAPRIEVIPEIPPTNSFSLLAGYTFTNNNDSDSDYSDFDTVPIGFGCKVRQDLGNRISWGISGLRPLGVELGLDVTTMKNSDSNYYYNQLYMGIHFYYRVALLRNWYIMPRIGGGLSNLWVNKEKIAGENVQGDMGYAMTYALGVQKEFQNGMLLEFGMDIRDVNYAAGDFNNTQPWIMGGYRL